MSLDSILFSIAQGLLWPVNLLVLLSLAYAILSLGGFLLEWFLRRIKPGKILVLPTQQTHSVESLELIVLRELEGLRLCSRIAPMLGLVATMIPMGPALIAVSSGQSQEVAQNLAPAFAAVIVALVAASITFWIHSIRRRWLLSELSHLIDSAAQ
jgi:sterol desaturase/sphingolipid hydroxylase (fatty acid hydroxylase superfamily)